MSFERIEPKDQQEWLELRQTVVTATEVGALLGLNRWKSVKDIVEGKKKIEPFENAYTFIGQLLENIVAKCTNKVIGTDFHLFENEGCEYCTRPKAFYIDTNLRIGATPDAFEEKNGDITSWAISDNSILECKTTKPHNALRWAHIPPLYYVVQLYTQMMCCEREEGILSILSTNLTQSSPELNLPISIFHLTRDKELDTIILSEVKRFWEHQAADKIMRVNRKQTAQLELKLLLMLKKIY